MVFSIKQKHPLKKSFVLKMNCVKIEQTSVKPVKSTSRPTVAATTATQPLTRAPTTSVSQEHTQKRPEQAVTTKPTAKPTPPKTTASRPIAPFSTQKPLQNAEPGKV